MLGLGKRDGDSADSVEGEEKSGGVVDGGG